MRRLLLVLIVIVLVASPAVAQVGPVPQTLRDDWSIPDFYQKHLDVGGLPILGSEKVSDNAFREARWILQHLLEGREDILTTLAGKHVHLAIMAYNEYTTDIPEHKRLRPRVYWDRRARGLGGKPVSCGEENLLCFPNDPYHQENLLIHEFSHAIHGIAMRDIDPTFDRRLREAYRAALARGLWLGTYAGSNREEYWAEAAQSWFDDNRENDALHNHVNTRDELKQYDPALAALCAEVFGDRPWRYRKPTLRDAADREHLPGFDPQTSPQFQWRTEPVPDAPQVRIQTELGDIELELDAARAPKTVANFLHYVHQGLFNDGIFFRTVTLTNQPDDAVKIQVVQAQTDPSKQDELLPLIPLERTRDTGLRHTNGTISMARLEPDSGRNHFFICIGDQPELDFGGQRNPDGQGFAAFGRVTKGMDVVHKLHQSPAEGQQLNPPIRIQRAIRLN